MTFNDPESASEITDTRSLTTTALEAAAAAHRTSSRRDTSSRRASTDPLRTDSDRQKHSESSTASNDSRPSDDDHPTDRGAAETSDGTGHGDDELIVGGHRINWWLWALVGLLVLAIIFTVVALVHHKNGDQQPAPDVTGTSTSSQSSRTVTRLSDKGLLTAEDAKNITDDTWTVASTTDKVSSGDSNAISCVVRDTNHPRSVSTWQRALSTNSRTATAALHRIDSYADDAAAQAAYQAELASLASCSSVPAHIVSAATFQHLGDQSQSVTIAYQGVKSQYRTVVLMRMGTVIEALDVANVDSAVPAAKVGTALAAAATRSCDLSGGTCPAGAVKTADAVPPVAGDAGWLITSDLPRITPDAGEWSTTPIGSVTTKGTQCEGVTLATFSGPTARNQRTYLLYQDSAAPQGFGVDEVNLTFKDSSAASASAKKIGDSISRCSKNLSTAKVSDAKEVKGPGANGKAVSGRTFTITADAGSGKEIRYQVAIASVNNKVTYLLANTTKAFGFPADEWAKLGLRAAQRASQVR
ncbi:MAG: hypothetical protein E6777_07995 [Propionibacterium sp.]|nr:hypothetical protein [Propionibacterium sp.]